MSSADVAVRYEVAVVVLARAAQKNQADRQQREHVDDDDRVIDIMHGCLLAGSMGVLERFLVEVDTALASLNLDRNVDAFSH